ncbi:S8 family serine peptidase [Anaerotignum sp.]|uniref:S8 family serine peptidase n=1 Tax=Anaerotignum sp. TaxID=2039241 RepID=UPI0028ACA879|nr:S8 family serine peptidase [Anaerotignum sp.]
MKNGKRKLLWGVVLFLFVVGLGIAVQHINQKDKKDETYVIAVIDTGVDYNHPDLKDHMWVNKTSLPGTHGYDFINDDDDPMDDFGHGTHCAGIILEETKRLGLKGNVEIMALKYMDETGGGLYEKAIAAYQYIIDAKKQGVNVVAISNSWGITENPVELENIIQEAGKMGIISVCAAGNSSEDLDRYKTFPAGYESPYTVIVAAATDNKELASFSCYGKHSVDVAALGTNILSAYHKDAYLPSDNMEKDFTWSLLPTGNQVYSEGSTDAKYVNVREYTFEKPLESGRYFGIEFMSHAPKGAFSICYVETYQEGSWWQAGAFGLPDINFYNTKYFALPEKAEKLRLICTSIDSKTELNIRKMGYGESGGKYFRMSGTSMAAPAVTAEVVWLMESSPKALLEEIRARIIGGVDKVLPAGLIASDGMVNAAKAKSDPAPVAVSASAEGNTITIDGWFFGESTGSVTSALPCKVLTWKDKSITLQYEGDLDNYVDFTIARADGVSSTQRLIFEARSKAWEVKAPLPVKLAYATAVSCDNAIYVMGGTLADGTTNNQMYRYDSTANSWASCGKITDEEQAEFLQYGISAVCYHGKIILMTFDSMTDQNRFFEYDPKTEVWQAMKFSSLPETKANATLAVYQDELYLVGGIAKGEADPESNAIWKMETASGSWTKVAELSGERFDAIAAQVGNSLLIVGGKQGENKPVATCEIFDGKKVEVMGTCPLIGLNSTNSAYSGGNALNIFTDGNTFDAPGITYDLASGKWTNLTQRLGFSQRTEICHAVLDNQLYLIGGLSDSRITDQVDAIHLP